MSVNTSVHKKIISVTTLVTFISSCLPTYAYAIGMFNPVVPTVIAPNLMVIFGNSYSMNRNLDDSTYPNLAQDLRFNDISLAGTGTPFLYPLYGDQPTSKLYVAKQAFTTVLNSGASKNINLGLATFRQTFGMEAASSELYTRGTWATIVPNDPTMLTGSATTQQKTDYGAISSNFRYVNWGRIWVGGTKNRSAMLGKGVTGSDYNKGVVDDTLTKYNTGITNGLPNTVVYKPITTLAYDIDPVTGNAIASPTTKIHDQTFIDNANVGYGLKSVTIDTGATGNKNPGSVANPLATWKLCQTYYTSQGNEFGAMYLADKDIVDAYAGKYGSYTLAFMDWETLPFNPVTNLSSRPDQYMCSWNGLYKESTHRISNTSKSDGSRIWFSGIPNYYSGVWSAALTGITPGILTGWSGETTYTETDPLTNTGTTTANYPSGVADPMRSDRSQIVTKGIQQTAAKHMGVFLDLPLPALGYADQRNTIKGFMGLQQMSQSGEDYNPTTQIIAAGKGIAASTFAWDANQSPIYDSLSGALAYYTSYKALDPYNSCRSNNVLLFFDGKEDAHWLDVAGTTKYLSPADIAAKLKAIGVKTYVVILSNNGGDISDANAIAQAGGTTAAYSANSATTLLSAFTNIFSGLSGADKTTAAPAMPPQIGSGGKLYQASYTLDPMAGHLKSYSFDGNGYVTNTPLWDTAALMTTTNRTSQLLSNDATGAIVSFSALDSAVFSVTTPPPTVADIINYTITPSYNANAYLAGRAQTSFMGMYSDQSSAPIMVTPPSNVTLDAISNYAAYKTNQSTRKTSILVQNDDGFLYAADADTGNLLWGWMPRPVVSQLKNYTSFWQSGNMRGGVVVADAPSGTSYKTYVLGTAQSGAIHYALTLKNDANTPPNVYPDNVAWITSVSGANSSQAQAPVVSYVQTAGVIKGYANYIVNAGPTSTLYVHEITAGAIATTNVLDFTPYSELTYDNGFFYVADIAGKVWKMTASAAAADMVATKVLVGETFNKQQAKYVGVYKKNNIDYVWAAGSTGITVFSYENAMWRNVWESHVDGAGSWTATGTYTADLMAGTTPSVTSIQKIPINAFVTARPAVVNDALLLPVLVSNTANACVSGDGYYTLYGIDNGFKPTEPFYSIDASSKATEVSGNLYAGVGAPMSPVIGFSSQGSVIEASANQTKSGGNGITASYLVKSKNGTNSGLVSWREVTH